jgi:hypothetical protein
MIGFALLLVSLLAFPPRAAEALAMETTEREQKRIHSRVHAEHRFAGGLSPGERRMRIVDPIVDMNALPEPADVVSHLLCGASAVLTGIVTESRGVVSEDRDLVYTDSLVEVDEVLGGEARPPIVPGQSLLLTRPGGTAIWDGRTTSVNLNHYPELAMGQRYLFFVGAPLESGAYTTVSADGVFRLTGDQVEPLGPWIAKGPPPPDLLARIREHEPCR